MMTVGTIAGTIVDMAGSDSDSDSTNTKEDLCTVATLRTLMLP